jgi:rhodanese-related sulfurtransferase
MATITRISPSELSARMSRGEAVELIDVRTGVEFAEVHAAGARHVPLDRVDPATFPVTKDRAVYLICKSGSRAAAAAKTLAGAEWAQVIVVDGGTDAWVGAGLPHERTLRVISLERQVHIAAGTLVLTGVLLGALVSPWFYALAGFVGAGLVFAGVANFCGMALLLARAPWNRDAGACVTGCAMAPR